jgi:hypothetical protein
MVRNWQSNAGRSPTGLIEPGQIIVTPGPIRVAEHLADIGDIVISNFDGSRRAAFDNAGSDFVLRYSETRRSVTVPLDVSDHGYAKSGKDVVITLPDRQKVRGVIGEVGMIFDEQGLAEATIAIPDQDDLGELEAASVDIEFVTEERQEVLAVPVTALLAMTGGGYGVEVMEGGSVRLVPVATGMFADGRVEIFGDGIAEGVKVAIP